MPRPRSGTELESLEAQREALERKIKEVAAREKAKKAAEDNRRWLLTGQVAIQQMQAAPEGEFFQTIMALLDEHTRSAADRALFGLPALRGTNGADHDPGQKSRLS
jgi:hypothetical protein